MHSPKHRNNNQNKLSQLSKVSSVDNLHQIRMRKPLEHFLYTNDYSVSNQKPGSSDRKLPILGHCRSGSNILKQYEQERQSVYNDVPVYSAKSIDSNGNFQKVINHYKLENQNLKKQNTYLVGELKELKKRQKINQHQLQRMQYLEQRLQKLEFKNTNEHKANECKADFRYHQMVNNEANKSQNKKQICDCQFSNNKHNNFTMTNQKKNIYNTNFISEDVSFQSTPRNNQKTLRLYNSPGKDAYYNKFYGEEIRKQPNFSKKQETNLTFESSTADDIKEKITDLNNEFNYLIEECAKQKDGLRKFDLRRSLAIVAKQMKTLKAQFQNNQKRDS